VEHGLRVNVGLRLLARPGGVSLHARHLAVGRLEELDREWVVHVGLEDTPVGHAEQQTLTPGRAAVGPDEFDIAIEVPLTLLAPRVAAAEVTEHELALLCDHDVVGDDQ